MAIKSMASLNRFSLIVSLKTLSNCSDLSSIVSVTDVESTLQTPVLARVVWSVTARFSKPNYI